MQNILLADRIKVLCLEKKLPIKTLLRENGMNRNTIYDHERKNFFPSADKICRMADYLECSMDFLMGRTDKRETNV